MSTRQENTIPGTLTRDFSGRSPFPAQPLHSLHVPSCIFKDLPNVVYFLKQEFGEEKQKGSAVCLFLARLGAGETAMNVT